MPLPSFTPPRRLPLAAAAVVLLAVAPPAAPDTWLLPTRPVVAPGLSVGVDVMRGAGFPVSGADVDPDELRLTRLRLAGQISALVPPRRGAATRFDVFVRRPGIATLWVELAGREIELTPDDVAAHLTEWDAPDSVRYRYLAQPIPRHWRERRVEHATTHVRVTSPVRPVPPGDSSWGTSTGMAFELVPERDPTTLHAGDVFVARVLRRGSPVGGATVRVVGPGTGDTQTVVRRSDALGRVAFVVPRAGRWMARVHELRRAASPSLDWESDVATLTFAVR